MEPEALDDQTVRQAADLLVQYPFTPWRYGDSIGFEGLLAASEILADDRYLGWTHGALRAWAATRGGPVELDNTIPGKALCLVYERTGDAMLLDVGLAVANELRQRPKIRGVYASWRRAPLRKPSSGAPLTPAEQTLLAEPGPGVFIDCLHFDPPFFVHLGLLTGDSALIADGVDQALGYVRLLQQSNGLFDHFWLEATRRSYGAGWGRGQGWALLGLLDVLACLALDHPSRSVLEQSTRELADALIKHQRAALGWGAAIDDEASDIETSTGAFVAAGFARGHALGILDDSVLPSARDAWAATLRMVEQGALQGVSVAIWPSTGAGHYAHPQLGSIVPWGQGPLLLAAFQMAQLPMQISSPGAVAAEAAASHADTDTNGRPRPPQAIHPDRGDQ